MDSGCEREQASQLPQVGQVPPARNLRRDIVDDASFIQARLLQRIASRDREALGELYDQVAGILYSICCRILGDPHEAEEVIQDVFLQVWNKAASYDSALGSAFHWTAGIARNRSIDRLRSRQRRARLVEGLQDSLATELSVGSSTTADRLEDFELAFIRAAVNSLPHDQRLALEMAFFAGLTHAEIAEATGEPLGTIKARIRRGMLKLRDLLHAVNP